MNHRLNRRVSAAALAAASLICGVFAAIVSAYAFAKARMPYNEEGNYFDGVVVHHAGGEYVYALFAVLLWALAVVLGFASHRWFKTPGASGK